MSRRRGGVYAAALRRFDDAAFASVLLASSDFDVVTDVVAVLPSVLRCRWRCFAIRCAGSSLCRHFDVVTDVVVVLTSVHPGMGYAFGATKGVPQGGNPFGIPAPLVVRAAHPRTHEFGASRGRGVHTRRADSWLRASGVCWWPTSDPSQRELALRCAGTLTSSSMPSWS